MITIIDDLVPAHPMLLAVLIQDFTLFLIFYSQALIFFFLTFFYVDSFLVLLFTPACYSTDRKPRVLNCEM